MRCFFCLDTGQQPSALNVQFILGLFLRAVSFVDDDGTSVTEMALHALESILFADADCKLSDSFD